MRTAEEKAEDAKAWATLDHGPSSVETFDEEAADMRDAYWAKVKADDLAAEEKEHEEHEEEEPWERFPSILDAEHAWLTGELDDYNCAWWHEHEAIGADA